MEKANECKMTLYFLFVDFQTAFDTVDNCYLWNAVTKQGTNAKLIRVMEDLCKNSDAYVKLVREGPKFRVKTGVRQGDPLSPNLVSCVIEEMNGKRKRKRKRTKNRWRME